MANTRKKSAEKRDPGKVSQVLSYFVSRAFAITLLSILGAAIVTFMLVNFGLNAYTRHGQRLKVNDYIGMKLGDARRQIENADFRVAITDSVFLVNQPPGVVLRQDPAPGSYVKENRRIYLTITKTIPDDVTLPPLTGTYDFDRYNRKLAVLDINGRVRERTYSSRYEPNTILKVWYEGREITEAQLKEGYTVPKGATLEFTVTSRSGGAATLPNLRCRTLEEARFYINNYRLRIGRIDADATVTDREQAYIWRQDPPYMAGTQLPFDSEVTVYLTQQRPDNCN